jgi:type IV pilus assembly protein PilA
MPRSRPAFTLIELLIVVVIIGILAAIAVPRFAATKGKASLASIKSDLEQLTTAEEGYFYDSASYTTNLSLLAFQSSPGDVITLLEGTNVGWSATASNPLAYPHFCALVVGTATLVPPATTNGVVSCQ